MDLPWAPLNNGIWPLRDLKRTGARRASPVMAAALPAYQNYSNRAAFSELAKELKPLLVIGIELNYRVGWTDSKSSMG